MPRVDDENTTVLEVALCPGYNNQLLPGDVVIFEVPKDLKLPEEGNLDFNCSNSRFEYCIAISELNWAVFKMAQAESNPEVFQINVQKMPISVP